MRDSSSTYGRSCFAPSAQFRPIASGRAWRTEFQNASVVCPDSVRPEASVIVPEMMSGRSTPDLVERLPHREERRLGVQRVENRLDQEQIDAAFDQRARADRDRSSASWSKSMLRNAGSLTFGDSDAVRFVGPSAPATKRGLPVLRA